MNSEDHGFIPYQARHFDEPEMEARARAFFDELDARRSVRRFSDRPVPRHLIEWAIRAASTSPSGAHRQPWRFVAVSDPAMKRQIREAAEAEERRNYDGGRMPPAWREALAPLGTDAHKPYLERAPWLVIVFERRFEGTPEQRQPNYYVKESVGMACGLFVAAIHNMGLCTLTHTPSPMDFLVRLLGRTPRQERPFALFPIGYAEPGVQVPAIERRPLDVVSAWHEADDAAGSPRPGPR